MRALGARRSLGEGLNRLACWVQRLRVAVQFDDLQRIRPVSGRFGLDRGTPIDRYYIERFLRGEAARIRGAVLEVGGDEYFRRHGQPGSRCTVLHADSSNTAATLVGDLTRPETLPFAAFDCFICTQTFNFIFDVERAVHGAYEVLKPGGWLLATVAGISQISRYDMERWGDYWRFTDASLRFLFAKKFETVEIQTFGNVLAATAFLQGLAVEDLPDPALLDVADGDYQLLLTVRARRHGALGESGAP